MAVIWKVKYKWESRTVQGFRTIEEREGLFITDTTDISEISRKLSVDNYLNRVEVTIISGELIGFADDLQTD